MTECVRSAIVVLCAIGATVGVSHIPNIADSNLLQRDTCLDTKSWECIKIKIFSSADKILQNTNIIPLTNGIMFVKSKNGSELKPRSVNTSIGTMFFKFINSFLHSHKLQFTFEDADLQNGLNQIQRDDLELPNEIEESRGKKNKMKKGKPMKNMLLPLILGVKAKLALLAAMMGNMIAAIAGKAIVVSKIALILGIFLFLKKLVQDPPKEVKHEIRHKLIVPMAQNVKHEDWKMDQDDQSWNNYNSDAQAMAYSGQMYNINAISHH